MTRSLGADPRQAPAAPTSLARGTSLALMRRLLADRGRDHAAAYLVALTLMAAAALATALSAYLLKPVLNGLVAPADGTAMRGLAAALAALFVCRGAATYGSLVLLARTGNALVAHTQRQLYAHLLHQDMAFFQRRHSTEFITRIGPAANAMRDTLQILVTSAGRDALTFAGLVLVMIVQDPLLATVVLCLMPPAIYGLSRLVRRVRHLARHSFDGASDVMRLLQETLRGIRLVKSFNLETLWRARMDAAIAKVEATANHMASGVALASPLAEALSGAAIGLVILYGSWRIGAGAADAGSFFSFIAALLMAYEPAKRLARLKLEIQSGLVGTRLIYDVLDEPAAEASSGASPRPKLEVPRGAVTFHGVAFHYPAGQPVLCELDLAVAPGATLAIVGASGSGKSTIFALIERFFEPTSGHVEIDGQDIRDVDLASLRAQVAVVSQDPMLFAATIAENIGFGRAGATREAIVAAARDAGAHEFIARSPAGYDTPAGEQGLLVSAGERQRIAIARAMLKNAPILLLDEPTAALDPQAERIVNEALERLRHGRTTIIAAHRLHTIVNADRICILDQGRIAEAGTHASLMARRGRYWRAFTMQQGEGV